MKFGAVPVTGIPRQRPEWRAGATRRSQLTSTVN